MPRVYVSTYKKYSEGSIKGQWLDLENYDDPADFMRACRDLHSDESDPEMMFPDFEGIPREFVSGCWIKPEFWDYMNSDVPDGVKEAFMYLFDEWDEERCQGSYIGEFRNRADLAEDVVDGAGILRDVPDDVARYFNYEAYGRDLELGGDVREHNDHYFWTNYRHPLLTRMQHAIHYDTSPSVGDPLEIEMKFAITNQKDLREHFWNTNTDLERHAGWKQNQYPTDTRVRWVEFVDHMYREGIITEALADRATL